MNNIVKNTLILTAITVVSGLLLGVVYDITKEPIAQAQENTKQEAYRTVLSDASEFETVEFDADTAASLLSENGYTSDVITEIAEGTDASGATVGYVISVQSSEAYDGSPVPFCRHCFRRIVKGSRCLRSARRQVSA